MKHLSLFSTITAVSLLSSAYAAPTFVSGVTESSGWYDCNKLTNWRWEGGIIPSQFSYPSGNRIADEKMCWAHAASNILQWWQDRQASDLIPSGTPNGLAATATPYKGANNMTYYYDTYYVQHLAIFRDIAAHWSNDASWVKQAYNWYFNGGKVDAYGGVLNNADSGGYWSHLGLTMNADGVTSPLFDSYTFNDNYSKDVICSVLTGYIDNSYGTTLRVISSSGGHAITMWGYDYDDSGDLIVYLTDSDDLQHSLFKQKLVVGDDKLAYLTSLEGEEDVYSESYTTNVDGESVTFTGIILSEAQALTAPILNVPEPSSSMLAMLGGMMLMRRRRR